MRVELTAGAFEDASEWCLPIFWFGHVGKHRVIPAPGEAAAERAFETWCDSLRRANEVLAEKVVRARDGALQLLAREPSGHCIIVDPASSPVAGRCTPEEAFRLLQRPYRVLLENGFNDRAFLLRMAGETERKTLDDAFAKEWLEFDHGGGISSMPGRVKELVERGSPVLLSCLFDSDAQAPGQPSKDSDDLAALCRHKQVHHHQLLRRSIENYLPRSAFDHWAGKGTNLTMRQQRASGVAALFRRGDAERHHADLKKMLGAELKSAKLHGDDEAMRHTDVTAEGGPAELEPFVRELLERAR